MSNFSRRLFALAGLLLALGAGMAAWRALTQPKILTIAVGPPGYDDFDFVEAWSRALADRDAGVRLKVLETAGPVESLAKLKSGEARLAVTRADLPVSERVRAVALLHSDPVVIVAPAKPAIDNFGQLKGKSLGVIGSPGANEALIATLTRHYRADVRVVDLPSAASAIAAAFRAGKANALLFVAPTTRSAKVGESWAAVRRAVGKKLEFVAIDDNDAIVEAAPAYETEEIAAGLFGGRPPLPEEEVSTLRVPIMLVADRRISNRTIGALTRNLFENRQRIAEDSAIANLIKSASTDKDATIPIHPGAQAYYDGEETTLLEQYGDWLYYGPLLLGALGSGILAVLRYLGFMRAKETSESLLAKVPEVIGLIKAATTNEDLDRIHAGIDAAVERFSQDVVQGNLEEQKTAPIALAVDYLGRMIAERRRQILGETTK
ncbi:TAXI family TRAP transporter solute-binding subunit [Rhodoblastus acidophilus]|uniref:TAXI family TRAP transporter solute-binding subunit n=1 Tax=Candidatus Rhodoblastus alkanivorans TaxID=2954117 RepID=A0ABS9Z4K4_9HYPH|nr:TAXI family TRAP transporter solute-binding subunit [Candidatus Rhodoblastus alkanivorans]MCI4680675.1 TAXI family TRAP transporter solute-binding subunit [Candidatus Rhodoblastus alkanivorans]MCI4682527.1 TAXI family TRAP transporter solute-binding subunit [Candidatus Rhodoblastus alkanivorans]MDI4639833.1 TAXI family TRAP transporter solute-binding subunit [Rhodoblastus acidophilus]